MFIVSLIQTVDAAVTELIRHYRQAMHRLANSILHDRGLAEDAVQEASIKLCKISGKVKDINSAQTKSLVFTVTRNAAIDSYRKQKS